MIRPATILTVSDNSGAITVGCISVPKLLTRTGPSVGQTLTVSVKKSVFKKNIKKKSRIVNKSQILQVVLVTTARQKTRIGQFKLKSSLNAVVLLNQYDLPYGTRLFGPVFREVRQKIRFRKIISLAKYIK